MTLCFALHSFVWRGMYALMHAHLVRRLHIALMLRLDLPPKQSENVILCMTAIVFAARLLHQAISQSIWCKLDYV